MHAYSYKTSLLACLKKSLLANVWDLHRVLAQSLYYDMLFFGKTSEMAEVAKTRMKRSKVRDNIMVNQTRKQAGAMHGWRLAGNRVLIFY